VVNVAEQAKCVDVAHDDEHGSRREPPADDEAYSELPEAVSDACRWPMNNRTESGAIIRKLR
jgi:hypothetical protein